MRGMRHTALPHTGGAFFDRADDDRGGRIPSRNVGSVTAHITCSIMYEIRSRLPATLYPSPMTAVAAMGLSALRATLPLARSLVLLRADTPASSNQLIILPPPPASQAPHRITTQRLA